MSKYLKEGGREGGRAAGKSVSCLCMYLACDSNQENFLGLVVD